MAGQRRTQLHSHLDAYKQRAPADVAAAQAAAAAAAAGCAPVGVSVGPPGTSCGVTTATATAAFGLQSVDRSSDASVRSAVASDGMAITHNSIDAAGTARGMRCGGQTAPHAAQSSAVGTVVETASGGGEAQRNIVRAAAAVPAGGGAAVSVRIRQAKQLEAAMEKGARRAALAAASSARSQRMLAMQSHAAAGAGVGPIAVSAASGTGGAATMMEHLGAGMLPPAAPTTTAVTRIHTNSKVAVGRRVGGR